MILEADNLLTDDEFQRLTAMVHRHCGINLQDGKRDLVRARLAKRIRAGGFPSASDYLRHVLADASGREFTELVDALSTNLTSFFRERDHFDLLEKSVLPELIQAKRRINSREIRIWSAGCSSGEEAYSLAITLLETIPNPGEWDIKILATDLSRRVLRLARAGIYEKSRIEPLGPARRAKFLLPIRRQGQSLFQVTPDLQRLIYFRYLNLTGFWPFSGKFDLIFCRNVMIYFDKATQQHLVERFWHCLPDNGMLLTGHSESLTGIQHRFRFVQPAVYRKS